MHRQAEAQAGAQRWVCEGRLPLLALSADKQPLHTAAAPLPPILLPQGSAYMQDIPPSACGEPLPEHGIPLLWD